MVYIIYNGKSDLDSNAYKRDSDKVSERDSCSVWIISRSVLHRCFVREVWNLKEITAATYFGSQGSVVIQTTEWSGYTGTATATKISSRITYLMRRRKSPLPATVQSTLE